MYFPLRAVILTLSFLTISSEVREVVEVVEVVVVFSIIGVSSAILVVCSTLKNYTFSAADRRICD